MVGSARFKSLWAGSPSTPVVIVESDDWGPGPQMQAEALWAIAEGLASVRDRAGRPALMTVGVVLSLPDPQAIEERGEYGARFLDHPAYRPVLEALKAGEEAGVFELQLHGLAHFWPASFMAAWQREETVRRWLQEDGWRTEKLPAWLQSRWVDSSSLPTQPLAEEAIRRAVQEEVQVFRRCFGRAPKVAVPPTFVWTEEVERAYAEAGVEVLITPGSRYPGRDLQGKLLPAQRRYVNGERLPSGLIALVREVYFEPVLGHDPKAVVDQIERKWRRREPALLETHRFNFLDGNLAASLAALKRLLQQVLERLPEVRFLSSRQVAEQLAGASLGQRLQSAWRRFWP
jgi:hypothetical protein